MAKVKEPTALQRMEDMVVIMFNKTVATANVDELYTAIIQLRDEDDYIANEQHKIKSINWEDLIP
jgi:hypothetical protein